MNPKIKAAAIAHSATDPIHFRSGAIDDFTAGAVFFQQSSGADEMAEALERLLTHNADLLKTVKNNGGFVDTWLNGIESAHHDAKTALAKYNSFIKTEEDGK